MKLQTLLAVPVLVSALALTGMAQEKKKTVVEPDPEVVAVDKEKAKELLDALEAAKKTKEREKILDALEPFVTMRNEKFIKPLDKLTKHKDASVRVLTVRALGSQAPAKKIVPILGNILLDRGKRNKGTPQVIAQAISSLRRLGCERKAVLDEISSRFQKPDHASIMRECARYFGDLRRKDKVKDLVYWVEAPQPADPNSDDNPPEDYWRGMWELWEAIYDHVLYALKKITGRDYTSHAEWRIWLRSAEAKALGIK
jgi:hypothetical protein